MDVVVGQLFTGLSIGSILLLAALGLSLTFGQMGVVNMAHGEFIMAGSYTAYVVQQVLSTGGLRAQFKPGQSVTISESATGGYRIRIADKKGFKGVSRVR